MFKMLWKNKYELQQATWFFMHNPLPLDTLGHYNITFGCEFFNLNQYQTRYDNDFEPQGKKNNQDLLRHSDWIQIFKRNSNFIFHI